MTERYITFINQLGGFDYWPFVGNEDKILDVTETSSTRKNVFQNWPKSYGAYADTISRNTSRRTRKQILVRSQTLTKQQGIDLGEQIKSSPLVQELVTRRNRRTMIVDDSSFTVVRDVNKVHNLSFTLTYTDDYPSQTT